MIDALQMQEITKKEDDTGPELEPEDKEQPEEKKEEAKPEDGAADTIEEIKS